MKFSDLQLTQAQRLELLAQSHWSIEEAACYFCDVKAVDLNKLSPVELQVLYETQVIYDIEELTKELPESFSNGEYFRIKYNNPHVTKKSLFPVEEFMLWANEQWPLTHGKQLPRIVMEYNFQKETRDRETQEITKPNEASQEFNLSPEVVELATRNPVALDAISTTQEENQAVSDSEFSPSPEVIEAYQFLRQRGVRIDLWILLCSKCYQLWWGNAEHPVPLPPVTTDKELEKRNNALDEEKATYNSWFKSGEPYASMNKSHVYEVIGGLLDPKNPGGRRPGSKNLRKRSSKVSDKGKS